MPQQGPLCSAEERMGFNVRRAGAGTNAAKFVFDEKLADEGLAKAEAS